MRMKRFFAGVMTVVVALTGLSVSAVTGKAKTAEQTAPLHFTAYTAAEDQLWRFVPADDRVEPEYYLQNIDTQRYLSVADGQLTAVIRSETNLPAPFAVSADGSGYTLKTAEGSLNTADGAAVLGGTQTVFELLRFADGGVTALRPSGTYALRLKGTDTVLTDSGDAYYTLSRNADLYSKAATQKWHVDTARVIGGEQYYTIRSLDSSRYLAAEGDAAVLRFSRAGDAALWRVTAVAYGDFPESCRMKDLYNHYYRLTNARGQILYVDGATGEFKLSGSVAVGPSSVFVFEEGGAFVNSGTFHIGSIGGRGGAEDVYDETCRRFLQSVKNGYELSVSLQPANKQQTQKWEIAYVRSEDRPGNWYRAHYYTIKSVEFDLYLTIENGGFVLAQRDETNDYQLWNFFDMRWGWISSQTGSDGRYANYYCVVNKGTGTAMSSVSSKLSLQALRGSIIGGDAGASWLLNGTTLDLGHAQGNNDPDKLIRSIEVTMLCYASGGLYLEGDGPDIPVEGSIKELYISADGDDANSGETADAPIKTIARALALIEEKTIAKRGRIRFRRGDIFVGNLELNKITGRTGKYIYFEDYGDESRANPVIVSDNTQPALTLNGCYCVSVKNIDFSAAASETGVVVLRESLKIQYEGSSVSGDKNATETGILLEASGDLFDSNHDNIRLADISVAACKTGIRFVNSGGIYCTDSEVGQTSGSGLEFAASDNIELRSCRVYDTDETGVGAVRIVSSGVIFGDLTVEGTVAGNGIELVGVSDASSTVRVSDSAIVRVNGVGVHVVACDKQAGSDGSLVAVDSLVLDDLLFSGNAGPDVQYTNTRADSSNLAAYIGNSTFVREDTAFYAGYPDAIVGVIQNNNTFITPQAYAQLRAEYREFVKAALAKKKGTTSDTVWESFQNALVEAIRVYNAAYTTKYTMDNIMTTVKTAMEGLTYDTGSTPNGGQKTTTEETVITIEQAVTEMLKTLAASDEETISLRVAEDFVLTTEMQRIVAEAGKKLKIVFTDENDTMLYQWSFDVLPCLYDIVLKVDGAADANIAALTDGQIVVIHHTDELPAGTKLIVQNTAFTERVSLLLKYYAAEQGALVEVSDEIGERKVLMSNDNAFLQLTVSRGGTFAVEKDTSTVNKPTDKPQKPSDSTNWVAIGIAGGGALLLIAAAVMVLLLVRKKRRQPDTTQTQE